MILLMIDLMLIYYWQTTYLAFAQTHDSLRSHKAPYAFAWCRRLFLAYHHQADADKRLVPLCSSHETLIRDTVPYQPQRHITAQWYKGRFDQTQSYWQGLEYQVRR